MALRTSGASSHLPDSTADAQRYASAVSCAWEVTARQLPWAVCPSHFAACVRRYRPRPSCAACVSRVVMLESDAVKDQRARQVCHSATDL